MGIERVRRVCSLPILGGKRVKGKRNKNLK